VLPQSFVRKVVAALRDVGFIGARRVGLTVGGVPGWRVVMLLRDGAGRADVAEMTVTEKQANPDLHVAVVYLGPEVLVSLLRDDLEKAVTEVVNRADRRTARALRGLRSAGPGGYSETWLGRRRAEIRPRMLFDEWLPLMLGWRLFVVPAQRRTSRPATADAAGGGLQDYNAYRRGLVEAEVSEQLAAGGHMHVRTSFDVPAGRRGGGGDW
jgi:hypothetical protein